MKASVLYHSKSGNTKAMAEVIARGICESGDISAKTFSVDEIDSDWVKESKCVIIGSPTYMASISAKMKDWLDNEAGKYGLGGKIGGAFATAKYVHGGGDLGIRLMLDTMMVFGMLVYSGGGAWGNPVIHLGPVAIDDELSRYEDTFLIYGKRMGEKTLELFG